MKRRGGDKRGSSYDRKMRKKWLLRTFGDGQTVPCVHCGEKLTHATLEADRIVAGASYRRENIQPSCRLCNARRGNGDAKAA